MIDDLMHHTHCAPQRQRLFLSNSAHPVAGTLLALSKSMKLLLLNDALNQGFTTLAHWHLELGNVLSEEAALCIIGCWVACIASSY